MLDAPLLSAHQARRAPAHQTQLNSTQDKLHSSRFAAVSHSHSREQRFCVAAVPRSTADGPKTNLLLAYMSRRAHAAREELTTVMRRVVYRCVGGALAIESGCDWIDRVVSAQQRRLPQYQTACDAAAAVG